MKVLRSELGEDRPKLGERVEFQGLGYRITRISDHPQFPMVVLVVFLGCSIGGFLVAFH